MPRFQHLNYETYLNKLLKDLNNQEEIIRQKKQSLENELKEIDQTISDKELSIDILVNMDSFKKMFNQKMVQHYENEFRKKEESLQLSNINNTNANININNNFNTINVNNNSTIQSFINKKIYNLNKKEKDQNIKSLKMQQLLRAKTFRAKLNNYILKNKEKTNKKAESLENEVSEQKINRKLVTENIQLINKRLKIIHINQKNIIDKLYIHYLTILKNGTDTREEGLAWVICEILNLGKKVMMSFLPKYLDENCVLYLFEMAHLLKRIKYLEQKFHDLKQSFSNKSRLKKNLSQKMEIESYIKSRKSLKDLKEKFLTNSLRDLSTKNVQNKISQSISLRKHRASLLFMAKVKKSLKNVTPSSPTFVHGDPNHYYSEENIEIPDFIKFKDIDKYTLKNNNYLIKKTKNIKFEECVHLSKEIEKLKKIKEELKNKEMCRIFEEFKKNKYYEKYNVDKNTLINALIGEDNLMTELYNQKKKEKLYNEEIQRSRLYKKEVLKKNVLFMNKNSINSFNIGDSSFNIYNNFNVFKENENFNTIANSKIIFEDKKY